jgi:threonine synthase
VSSEVHHDVAPGALSYVSTRGSAPELGFADVLLAGLASDGGLYVPSRWPHLGPEVAPGAVRPYIEVAVEVMWPFVAGGIERAAFEAIVTDAYGTFETPEVTPLVELGDGHWLLELFHGPTLAFKDVALQLLGRLFDHELRRRPSTPVATGTPLTSSSCIRPGASRRCNDAR